METLSLMLQSPAWWVSTVLVALVINLFSNRLSRIIDKWTDGWSEKRQKKLEQEKEAYKQEVKALAQDPTDLIIKYIRTGVSMITTLVVMFALTTISLMMAIADIDVYVRFGINMMGLGILVVVLAMAKRTVGNIKKCHTANVVRKRAQELLKAHEPDTNAANLDDHESVSPS
jgi:hypothetical protein